MSPEVEYAILVDRVYSDNVIGILRRRGAVSEKLAKD